MRHAFVSLVAIIVATSGVVNAADSVLTKKQSRQSPKLSKLVEQLKSKGKTGALTASAALHGLKPDIPIRYLEVSMDGGSRNNARWCDLIFRDHDKPKPVEPDSLLIIDRSTKGNEVDFFYFRYDINGRLLSVSREIASNDDSGNPIRGSKKAAPIDKDDPQIVRKSDENLAFWLNGQYAKYSPIKHPGGAAPESARKPAAATAAK